MMLRKIIQPEHRGIYRVTARNFTIAVYDWGMNGFWGIREKGDARYVDFEFREQTAWALEKIGQIPDDIKLFDESPDLREWLNVYRAYEP
jgi:hypothetical protein